MDETTQAMDDFNEVPRLPKSDLPEHDEEDEDFVDKIDESGLLAPVREKIDGMTVKDLTELGFKLMSVDEEIEEIKRQKVLKEAEWTKISNTMVDLMESAGMKNFKTDKARFQFDPKLFTSVLKSDREKLITWLKSDDKTAPMVKETVHPGTLKAFVKELGKNNVAPPDFINVRRATEIKAVSIKPKIKK